jgi:spoIIIJ-associated protein
VSDELTVEASGETVGEAKWRALRELETRLPRLDKTAVRFQVLAEGERGLLGVGYSPARVLATVSVARDAGEVDREAEDESDLARRVRGVLEHVTVAMGLRCRIDIAEADGRMTATCNGGDLGLLIGRHGQTIDALQALVSAIARGTEEGPEVVIDVAGYRERRKRTIESLAVRAAEQVLREGEPVELEPMSAVERKLVHERLQGFEGVSTESEGAEPNRYVVVAKPPVREADLGAA